MSGFNLDFSGLFSGGFTNNLNKNNFNFSAYAPKKEEPVVDPIDVVSNQTPEAKVEILEGAGTVAITKQPEVRYSSAVTNAIAPITPDPITDAIQSVQPKPIDLGMDFSVIPETAEVSPLTSNIPVSSGATTNGSFMDVGAGQTGLSSNVNTDVGAEKAYDLLDGALESNSDIEDINNYLKSEQFGSYMSEYDDRLSTLGDYNRAEGATTNLLNQVGLPKALGVQGKYGGYKNYTYNGETNQYELTGDTEKSAFEAAAPDIIVGLATAAATAGVGSALAGSSAITGIAGGNTALATGLGQGIAGGLSTAIQGGDTGDILQSMVLSGVGGYTEGLNTLTSDAEYMLGLADQGAELAAHAETMNTVMDVVNLGQAVDEKDVLAALDAGLSLGGMNSSTELLTGKLEEAYGLDSFVGTNASVLSSAGLKAAVDIAGGADAGEVLQNTANSIIKDTIATEDNVRELLGGYAADGSYIGNNLDPLTKAFTSVAHAGLEGKNKEEMAGEFVKAYIKEGGQILPQSEESSDSQAFKDLEAWYHENIEDPLEQYWQDIEPYRERIETQLQAVGDLANAYVIDPAKRLVSTVVEQADSIVRALPSEKEDWENLEDIIKDNVIDPAASTVRETGRTVREWMPDGEGVDIELPSLPDLPDLDFDIPFEFEPEFSMEIKNIDYLYDDSDIIRNPLLSSTPTRVRNLAESIEVDKKRQEQVARRSSANEDKERIKRSKNLYKGKVGGTVRYNG